MFRSVNRFSFLSLLLLGLTWPMAAWGQGAFVSGTANSVVNGLMRPLAGASVTVCAASTSGLPCSPALANALFKDAALTQALANPTTTDSQGNYNFAMASGQYTLTITASGFVGSTQQFTVSCAVGACTASAATFTTLTVSGTATLTGNTTATAGQNIFNAYNFGGAVIFDGCSPGVTAPKYATLQAAINAAGVNGTVWMPPCQNLLTTTLTLSLGGQHLRCMAAVGIFDSVCRISQGVAANVAPLVSITGAQTIISDIEVDGQGSSNPSSTDNIVVTGATNVTLEHVNSVNAQRHNVNCFQSAGFYMEHLYSQSSVNGDGILLNQCPDSRLIDGSQSQLSGQYGLEILNSPTLRMDGSTEVSGSNLDDVYVHGTFPCPALGCANDNHLEFSQTANAKNNEIRIVCYDTVGGGYVAWGNMITTQSFGSGFLAANNTYSQIVLQDCDTTAIKNVRLDSKVAANQHKYAITATETASGRSRGNNCITSPEINGNGTNNYGTAIYNDSTTNGAFGCQMPVSGGSTTSFDLFDPHSSDTTPHKFFRVSGGNFQILNNAFGATIFNLDDLGDIFAVGGLFPNVAGVGPIGSAGSPFPSLCLGTAANKDFCTSVGATAGPRTIAVSDPSTSAGSVTMQMGLNYNVTSGYYQSKRGTAGCTTSGGASAFTGPCTTVVTFPASFLDTNFSVTCMGRSAFTGVPLLQGATATSVNSATVQTQQATGVNAAFATIDCIAVHD